MKKSILFASVIAIAAAGWILSGQFSANERPARADDGAAERARPDPAPLAVRVRRQSASLLARETVINGRTEPSRLVQLRAEAAGAIVRIGAEEGARVAAGDEIARIATDDRKARLAEAEALKTQRALEFEAAKRLSKKGFRAATKLAESQALLDAARAQVTRMRIDLRNTVVRAPFDGVLESRAVERGAYVKVGDDIARVVDLDPILVVGDVTERQVAGIAVGAPGSAALIDGGLVRGTVRYVSSMADTGTRTFRIELAVANADGAIRAGVTAELRLSRPGVMAHKVSPALLTLNSGGVIGVKAVDAENRVVFLPVSILADSLNGVWLGGLPATVTLITVGHEFVSAGQLVEPIAESVEGAS